MRSGTLDGGQRVPARRHPFDVEAVVGEPHGHQLGDVFLVVHDENTGSRVGIGHRRRA
jgi:hypothetical protein